PDDRPAETFSAVPVVAEAEAAALTISGAFALASAVSDLKMFGRLVVALWLAAVAVESLDSRAPGALSPSSLTFSDSLDTSGDDVAAKAVGAEGDRKSTRLNSSHVSISYAVFCLKQKNVV